MAERSSRAARAARRSTAPPVASSDDGCKTPERARTKATDEDVAALLGSPGFFNFCAQSLSPIALTRRSIGSPAPSAYDEGAGGVGSPDVPRFNSPTRPIGGEVPANETKTSRARSGMSDIERLALSAHEASVRRGSDSAGEGRRRGSSFVQRQLDVEFGTMGVDTLVDDRYVLQNMYDEFDDSVLGVEERVSQPRAGAAGSNEGAGKRSSTTGVSAEWTKGITKTLKNFDADSPHVGTRTTRRATVPPPRTAWEEYTPAKNATTKRGGSAAKTSKIASVCREIPESKKCNCKKSRCLKLYCECFAAGAFCKDCSCQQCLNTIDNASVVEKTRNQIESRNPNAFASKILEDDGDDARHTKGCHCKKSECLKKYCECFQAGVKCQDYCKCDGCKNKDEGAPPGSRGGLSKAVKTLQKAKSRGTKAVVQVAAESAARAIQDDLVIEDFKFDKLGSPLRSFSHADDLSSEYSNLSKSVEQSPLRTLLLSEGVQLSPFFSNSTLPQSALSPLRAGYMSPLRPAMSPLRPNGFMSPITPGFRAGPGRYSIRSIGKASVPLFNDDSGGSEKFRTPMDKKTVGFNVESWSHDASKDGPLRATFTSPIPLSTPDNYE